MLKKGGVRRASKDAVEELMIKLEDIGDEIAKKAWELAAFAGRKTVKAEDIKLAFE